MEEKINFKFLYKLQQENKVVEWLMRQGLISDRYVCPTCGKDMKLGKRNGLSDGFGWKCQIYGLDNFPHKTQRSVRKGTWFGESKLSLIDILLVSYMWCLKMSNESIMHDMNISAKTVVDWKRFCREICVDMCIKENGKLGGPGTIVEIDENEFGKQREQRGRRPDAKWVIGGIERGTDNCFMAVIKDRSKEVLLALIKQYILPGTVVISNCWRNYDCLEDEDYINLSNEQSIQFKSPENGTDTNTIYGTWNAVKRSMPGTNRCVGQFDSYLFEYIWRRRHKSDNLFEIFLESVKKIFPPKYED